MDDERPDLGPYRWALLKSVQASTDRLASSDERVYWTTVHRALTKHSPTGYTPRLCVKCGSTWPCDLVTGAYADLRLGPLGN